MTPVAVQSVVPARDDRPRVAVERRYDLDWMRVLAILVVFVFHCGRFFDTDGWHVKNPVRHESVMVWTAFLVSWMMPLMFLISGASTWFALKSRSAGRFIKERALRLLVPFFLGMFTHIAWQVYLERRSFSGFTGSFIEFYPLYFRGWYGFGGNFAWMGLHLWYLGVLFIFSALCLPFLVRWQAAAGARTLDGFNRFLARGACIYLLALPLMVLMSTLSERSFWGQRGFGGWPLPTYIFIFVYGFLLVSDEAVQRRVAELTHWSLNFGGAMFLSALALWKTGTAPGYGSFRYILMFSCLALGSWAFVLGLFGLARTHLGFSNRFVRYANEAVLPFYVLHQTIILTLGYYVVRWPVSDPAKFAVISVFSFALIVGCYEFGLRRFNLTRFLFGMKPLRT